MKKIFTIITVLGIVLAFAVSCGSAPPPAPAGEETPAAASSPQTAPPGDTTAPASGETEAPADTAAPELAVSYSSRYFDPNEGELAILLSARDASPIGNWKVEIREPQPPHSVFYQWEGTGQPPERLTWNGKNSSGELVQSASDYPLKFTASDTLQNAGSADSVVEIDIIVIRDGENLRVQVPSIVFGSYSGNWDSLDADTVAANDIILQRIAAALNKFSGYKVRVEGHANAVINPADRAASQREQTNALRPLSEARAKTIVDHLARLGVDRQRLSYYGAGGERPVASWQDRDNWWKNRRVEFILEK